MSEASESERCEKCRVAAAAAVVYAVSARILQIATDHMAGMDRAESDAEVAAQYEEMWRKVNETLQRLGDLAEFAMESLKRRSEELHGLYRLAQTLRKYWDMARKTLYHAVQYFHYLDYPGKVKEMGDEIYAYLLECSGVTPLTVDYLDVTQRIKEMLRTAFEDPEEAIKEAVALAREGLQKCK